MSDFSAQAPEPASPLTTAQTQDLLLGLRRKQGNWVQWGESCQTLQKAGLSPQSIFEETGFEPIQQNQVIVAAQVFHNLVQADVPAPVQDQFRERGSDLLYELRILNQTQRAAAAELLFDKQLDLDGAKEVAKAMKDFSRLTAIPEGFSEHPGDAVAYHFWKLTRQQSDLQTRSRLIAKAFAYVHSVSARQQIEKLLTDFAVSPKQEPPLWPMHRIDSDENLPRLLPLVGQFPLTRADLEAVPLIQATPPFNWVSFGRESAWVGLPGWQVILKAVDPVAILIQTEDMPFPPPGASDTFLLIVDRAETVWSERSYFLDEQDGQLQLQWFEVPPPQTLLARVILVLRQPRVLDSDYQLESWQIDE